jgi:Fic family protein
MNESELSGDAPGRLVSYGRRSYYDPEPLPPARDLDLDDEFYETLADAAFWLGKLAGLGLDTEFRQDSTDFAPVLYTSLLRKEAMESTEIEGADASFDALHSFETTSGNGSDVRAESADDETKHVREVLNYETAIEQGIAALDDGQQFTVELLHSLHETLLTGIPEERRETDDIGRFKQVPNNLGDFVPPVPDAAERAMEALLAYLRSGTRYHPLVAIALTHYQFETIHPYGDGHGRLGRLLITLQLYDADVLERPTLSLSEYFNRNKETYVERMEAVRRSGAWEAWLSFFVEGVAQQAREAVDRSLALRRLEREYRTQYARDVTKDKLARSLFEQPYVTTGTVEDRFDVTNPTANKALHALEAEGVVEEVTGKDRYREYRAREIFGILEAPPETY